MISFPAAGLPLVIAAMVSTASLWSTKAAVEASTTIGPDVFYEGIRNGTFPVVVDVRSEEEWLVGHVANATSAPNLAQDGVELPVELSECTSCPIVVYCSSGNRAGRAIRRLETEFGFDSGLLYNGQGVSQWTSAGYPLDTSPDSTDPMCPSRNDHCEIADVDDTMMDDDNVTMTSNEAPTTLLPVINLSPEELYRRMTSNEFSMVLDVRTSEEFETEGHIPNVTFIENLAVDGVVPTLLVSDDATCRYEACRIAVTCRSGSRAAVAIGRLQTEFGFVYAQFYNGGGVSQWRRAGYELESNLDSVTPDCAADGTGGDDGEGVGMSARDGAHDGSHHCDTCCSDDRHTGGGNKDDAGVGGNAAIPTVGSGAYRIIMMWTTLQLVVVTAIAVGVGLGN